MPTLYTWLFFVHVLAVGTFLFAHGVSGGASFLLRTGFAADPLAPSALPAIVFSIQPAILLVIVTGIWMTLAGHWSGRVWPWASLALLIVSSRRWSMWLVPFTWRVTR